MTPIHSQSFWVTIFWITLGATVSVIVRFILEGLGNFLHDYYKHHTFYKLGYESKRER